MGAAPTSKIDGYIASLVTLLFSFASFAASAVLPNLMEFIDGHRFPKKTNRNSNALAHDAALFFSWHRYFVHVYERSLRERCDYNGPTPWVQVP
jgi:hypothetical protein